MTRKLKFTRDMIQAIREGRKTQTRRPIEPQPRQWLYPYEVGDVHEPEPGLLIRIVSIGVERVQDITDEDAIKEGIFNVPGFGWDWIDDGKRETWSLPRGAFMNLWNSIYEKKGHGWETNPWVTT